MARVLVVDDDPALLRALRVSLSLKGHEVVTAATGEQGISHAALSSPDVIVLDLGLPDIDGLKVCRRIREWDDVPIVVLSAIGSEDRKVAALDEGADDYMTKPFGVAELEARIRTAIRHHKPSTPDTPSPTVTVGSLEVDLVHREAQLDGDAVELTAKEFELLSFLARHAGKTCTHQMILTEVWGRGYSKEAQYLHAYVHRLRQKLGAHGGVTIKTAPGIGYVLTVPEETVPEETGPEDGALE
jgi:two-component system, OmpR family, KDP operon response regulator KdpE